MCGELASIVGGDSLEILPLVWHKQPPHGLCQRHGLLAVSEFLHDQEIDAALCHCQDGIAVLVHYQVHLPVSESLLVGLPWTLVDADPVPDTWGYGLMPVGRSTAVFHPMPAVPDQLPTCILADHLVDGFMGNAGSLLRQIAGYLFGRPLLLNDIREFGHNTSLKEYSMWLRGARKMHGRKSCKIVG